MADPDKRGTPAPWMTSLAALLLGVVIGGGIMFAANGYLVRSYLLNHPEVLPEAMDRLRERQAAEAVRANRAAIETPFHGAWAGAANGDVTLVEFFDYACPYCRASNPDITRLLNEDRRLKVVWRDYPVLGPDSEQAAVASLAAAQAGRYRQYHDALYAAGRPSATTIATARQAAGLPETALNDAIRGEVQRNYDLARAIGATGTPTFVIGDRVLQGAVGYDALKAAIAEARAARG